MKRERKMIRVEEIFQYADQMSDNWYDCLRVGDKEGAKLYADKFDAAIDIMHWLGIKEQYD